MPDRGDEALASLQSPTTMLSLRLLGSNGGGHDVLRQDEKVNDKKKEGMGVKHGHSNGN